MQDNGAYYYYNPIPGRTYEDTIIDVAEYSRAAGWYPLGKKSNSCEQKQTLTAICVCLFIAGKIRRKRTCKIEKIEKKKRTKKRKRNEGEKILSKQKRKTQQEERNKHR